MSALSRNRRLLPPIGALSAFDCVARTGSFTAAAEELALSQSAVSREIKSLEARLGTVLLIRSAKGVSLTPAGDLYVKHVRAVLEALSRATSEVMVNPRGGVLRLSILATLGTRWLVPLLPELYAKHPEIEFSITTRPSKAFSFSEDHVDAHIQHRYPYWPNTRAVKILELELFVTGTTGMVRQFDGGDWLGCAPLLCYCNDAEAWPEWFAENGKDYPGPHRVLTFETYQMVFEAAVAGMGLAIVPREMIQRELATGQLIISDARPLAITRPIYIIYPKEKEHYLPLQKFLTWLTHRIQSG